MKILVACEYSGRVRDAFLERGHDAWSCDLEPCESDPARHIQGDVLPILDGDWDMVIAHPPCTYLANSGVRWLHSDPSRWERMREGAEFFLRFLHARAPRVAVENPVMHKYAREIIGRGPDFTVQPWQHGDGYVKRTCFWTRGLPPLTPTNIVEGREAECHRMPPGPDRWKARSRTYPGIARAIAGQWG